MIYCKIAPSAPDKFIMNKFRPFPSNMLKISHFASMCKTIRHNFILFCLFSTLMIWSVGESASNKRLHYWQAIDPTAGHHRTSKHPPASLASESPAIVASFSLVPTSSSTAFPLPLHSLSRRQTNFSHLVYDARHAQLYIGGTNYLLQLDNNLRLMRRLRTGPLLDSAHCSPTDCSGVESKDIRPSSNFNKALLLEPGAEHLIACGSAKQGACFRWPLNEEHTAPLNKPLERGIDEQLLIKVPVAANDENSSTVAFIGPAHYDQPASNALYVAVTNTKLGNYRELVPAVSSRSLDTRSDQLFKIIERSFTDNARVDISSHLRDYYLVQYVYGFHLRGFVYFVQVQRRSHLRTQEEMGVHSRISRVCSSDAGFHSYSEISLECVDSDLRSMGGVAKAAYLTSLTGDHHVLFVTFSRDQGASLCAFPMLEIERKFDENIHLCYNGSVRSRNMDYIAGSLNECPEQGKSGNIMNFCEETVKLNGSIPVIGHAVHIDTKIQFSSLLVLNQPMGEAIAFLGTNTGELLQVRLLPSGHAFRAEPYQLIMIDHRQPILSDMLMDESQTHLFVASARKVAKVAIHYCPHAEDCGSCLLPRNPFCGWCSTEKRCTNKADCSARDTFSLDNAFTSNWLSVDTGQCKENELVYPLVISIDQPQIIHLTIAQLPQLAYGFSYMCLFGEKLVTPAQRTASGLKCNAPAPQDRPSIIAGQDHISMNFAVQGSASDTSILQRTINFFDCSAHKGCRTCVGSQYPCNWCVTEGKCVSNLTACLRKSIIGENSFSYDLEVEQGRNFCPSLRKDNDILVPNGVRKQITLQIASPHLALGKLDCLIEIEGAREIVSASLKGDKVHCSDNIYTYNADTSQIRAQLTVLRNGHMLVESSNFTMYKCEILGSFNSKADCSMCESIAPGFQCTFCSGTCLFKDSCEADKVSICPPPRIDSMHPLSGPVEGGTILTIKGNNLGSSIEQLRNKISIGSSTCEPIQVSSSSKVICKTGPSHNPNGHSANLVMAKSAGLTFSQEKFHYKRVEIESVHPNMGPESGGTLMYLKGNNLNLGTNVQVFLDEIKCDTNKQLLSNERLVCRTRPSLLGPRVIQNLILRIDSANLTLKNPFTYTQNPQILDINPKHSFYSGGRIVRVRGERLRSIQTPKMAVYNNNQLINISTCEVLSDHFMQCATPSIKDYTKNLRLISGFNALPLDNNVDANSLASDPSSEAIGTISAESLSNALISGQKTAANSWFTPISPQSSLRFRIDFQLEDIQTSPLVSDEGAHLLMSDSHPSAQPLGFDSHNYIHYLPDPQPYRLSAHASDNVLNGRSLVITGQYLNSAISPEEINVTVGSAPCNLTSLALERITCDLHEAMVTSSSSSPIALLSSFIPTVSAKPLPVRVQFAQHLFFELGDLSLADAQLLSVNPIPGKDQVQSLAIKAAVVFGVILLLLCALLIANAKRKSLKMDKEYKRIQLQMESLGGDSLRKDCKQPLLSTSSMPTSIITSEPEVDRLLHPPIVQLSNVFFPGLQLSALTSQFRLFGGHQLHNERNLTRLQSLLIDVEFCEHFVGALESQNGFTLRDRVNVASLLSVSLLHRLDIFGELLERQLINAAAIQVQRAHASLFLRRTEHVVEKLLVNFLSVGLQKYVHTRVAGPLLRLVQAINAQCADRTPVDACTGKSWYSLDEQKLLAPTLTYRQMCLNVVWARGDLPPAHFLVPVLDCDSISQVKRKILAVVFAGCAQSRRPHPSDTVLEYAYAMQNEYTLRRVGTLQAGANRTLFLEDEDELATCGSEEVAIQVNTLASYRIPDGAVITLKLLQGGYGGSILTTAPTMSTAPTTGGIYALYEDGRHLYECIRNGSPGEYGVVRGVCSAIYGDWPNVSSAGGSITTAARYESSARIHLNSRIEDSDYESPDYAERFATRVKETRTALLPAMDELMTAILDVSAQPPVVRWLFAVLDHAARMAQAHDPIVLSSWKSNSLLLRFWMNLLKHPHFVFDIERDLVLSSNLDVLAQILMDACCEPSEQRSSNLFTADCKRYRGMILQFYSRMQSLPELDERHLIHEMQILSEKQLIEVDNRNALSELLVYANRYRNAISQSLQIDANLCAQFDSIFDFCNSH